MALGWILLYGKYRKSKRRVRELEAELESDDEICTECGYPLYKHSDDDEQLCPNY